MLHTLRLLTLGCTCEACSTVVWGALGRRLQPHAAWCSQGKGLLYVVKGRAGSILWSCCLFVALTAHIS